jgi:hypothetical protein
MNYIIKFKNKFKTLLAPCNGLLLEHTGRHSSLAGGKTLWFAVCSAYSRTETGGAGAVCGRNTFFKKKVWQ